MRYFFTADTHFGHSNIIKYCSRPFSNIKDHDDWLVWAWNSTVNYNDIVFHLGDLAHKSVGSKYIDRLNGRLILIRGNHDHSIKESCIRDAVIELHGKCILLVHSLYDIGFTDVDLIFCGHVHNNWKFMTAGLSTECTKDVCNVGVDVWGGRPVTIDRIMSEYSRWKQTDYATITKWKLR